MNERKIEMPFDFSGSTFNKKTKAESDSVATVVTEEIPEQQNMTVSPKYTLEDLILDEDVRNSLMDAISFYTYKNKVMYEWGLVTKFKDKSNLTINLYGESGTGKTMAAHADVYINI